MNRFLPRLLNRLIAPTLALGMAATAGAASAAPLTVQVINADAGSFHVNAALVTGPTEAVVIDSGFTRADALRIAARVLDSGKTLTTIFISNADPDFFFGAEVLKQLFPQARVLTSPAVRDKIQAKMAGKVAFWGPKLGANAPRQPLLPDALTGTTLTVDGEAIELRGSTGVLAHRPWMWIPSSRAIVGNIAVFGQLHVWTADTPKAAEREAWRAQLADMLALQPAIVVPGHMAAGTALDAGSVRYTLDYLTRFETELPKAANAAALIATMQQAYPQAGLAIALDIGAKVNKGEMAW
jgi:glyoxylase-like metal-dependent hydrolase (beta-lactamase superfamily II)